MAKKNSSSKDNLHFIFFAYAATGSGISGSDRIFIELAKRWNKTDDVHIYVTEEGLTMAKKQQLSDEDIHVTKMNDWYTLGFIGHYIARIILGIYKGLSIKLDNPEQVIVYSASEFWMDSLPSLLLKLRYPTVRLVGTWYQTAPNPLAGFAEGNRKETYRFKALLYYLAQLPIKPLLAQFADYIIVNNIDERKRFPKHNKKDKIIVLIGAVNLDEIDYYKKKFARIAKKYDAIFQGRFHPQKGVVEMVEIWKKVTEKIGNAQLIMLGDGPLMPVVKQKIAEFGLQNNVTLTGFMFDGEEKYKLFSQSKVVVHPSFYDSGGMAAAEIMAFGLPCVGFNLKAYESYYPVGMLKAEIGNIDQFAEDIMKLLENKKLWHDIGNKAEEIIHEKYSWDKRAREVYNAISS
jgi:glycosyltransferase involved in cell wall biosynthesis